MRRLLFLSIIVSIIIYNFVYAGDWIKVNNKYYYIDNGITVNRWVTWNNGWYYLKSDGTMAENEFTPDGYYVDSSGKWVEQNNTQENGTNSSIVFSNNPKFGKSKKNKNKSNQESNIEETTTAVKEEWVDNIEQNETVTKYIAEVVDEMTVMLDDLKPLMASFTQRHASGGGGGDMFFTWANYNDRLTLVGTFKDYRLIYDIKNNKIISHNISSDDQYSRLVNDLSK